MNNTLKAQGHHKGLQQILKQGSGNDWYHPANTHASMDLLALREELRGNPHCRICIYGPPGTGKTAYAQWLAGELEIPLHVHQASDLLSPYIGMTEQRLAAAFEKAQREKALLLLDEVDSFLQDRQHAQRSWEVSQVNEFLTQLEAFEGLFIASTNLKDRLDPASLRRFDLKLHFDYLNPEQSCHLFEVHCRKLKLNPIDSSDRAAMESMSNLTPGDFANVTRQHRFRKYPDSSAYLVALKEELAHKKVTTKGSLGFG